MPLRIRRPFSPPLLSSFMLIAIALFPSNALGQLGSRASGISTQTAQVPRRPSIDKPGEIGELLSFYGGQAYQPGGPLGDLGELTFTLTEDSSGNVTGTTYEWIPGTPYYGLISTAGVVSNNVYYIQLTSVISQNLPPCCHWCLGGGELTLSSDGETLDGPFQGNGCIPSTITASFVAGKLLGNPCNCAGGAGVGNPISLNTGNVYEDVTDYQTAGANKLKFARFYNSRALSTFALSLGQNWRSTFDRYLQIQSPSQVVVERPDGRQLTFTLMNESWTTDSDIDAKLVPSGSNWIFTDSDDTVETYMTVTVPQGTEGLLQAITARNGYSQTLTYNGTNQLLTVTDSYGRTLRFGYSGTVLTGLTTPDNQTISYRYSSAGQLISMAYPQDQGSDTYQYEYGDSNPILLTAVLDSRGQNIRSWTYDQFGRGTQSATGTGQSGNKIMVSYSPDTQNRTVTNALGVQDTYIVATLQNVPKVIQINRGATVNTPSMMRTFAYDGNGYLASQTDWNGNLTNYVNNIHGEPTTINEAVGSPVERTTTITYDSQFIHLPDSIATSGLTTGYTYDDGGNPLTKTLTDTTNRRGHRPANGQMRTWTYTWSNFLPASVKSPNGNTTTLTYDSSGALTAIKNPLNQTTSITGHTPGGYPQTIVDSNAVTTTLSYDTEMRVTSSAINTSLGLLTTQYNYWFDDKIASTVLPDGSVWSNAFDDALRVVENADIYQNNIQYTLDRLGNRTQINTYDGGSTLHRQHSATFDNLGRMLTDVGGVNQTTTYTHDNNGNALTVTDPLHHTTTQMFDALNRLSQSTDPNNGVTLIAYDAHDRPLTVTDPNGGQTVYTYDGFGDVVQQVSPDSGTTLYGYDLDGHLLHRVAATGAVTQYTYDALDRASTTTYPADPAENVTYIYDQPGHGFGIGRLTSLSDAAGSLSRSYDERGNVTQQTRSHGSVRLNTAYSYDRASRISRLTYPSNWQASYVRDNDGRVTSLSARLITATAVSSVALLPVVSNITYEPFGPATGFTFGNGIADSRSYDLDYRLLNLADSGAATVQNLTYGYDLADNVSNIIDAVQPNNSQSFGYDGLNRLNGASGGYGTYSWSYNGVGSRLSETLGGLTTNYRYGANNNQLLTLSQNGIPIQNIGYTADGNSNSFNPGIMSPGDQLITGLTYNQNAQLAAVMSGNEALAQYTYDAFGQRLIKALSGSTAALYQNDLSGRLLEETNGQGVPQADYVYLNGTPIATISPAAKAVYFLHDERLGTPQLATDSGQNTAWSATYLPFGGTSSVQGQIIQSLRFPGQHFDSESGWNHNGFRDYVQSWGRYLQTDVIGVSGGLNTYIYANANPSNSTDRSGLETSWWSRFTEDYQRAQDTELAPVIGALDSVRTAAQMYPQFVQYDQLLTAGEGLFSETICAEAATKYFSTLVAEPLYIGIPLEIAGNGVGAALDATITPYEDQLLDLPGVRAHFTASGLDYTGQRVVGTVGDEAYAKWWFYNNTR